MRIHRRVVTLIVLLSAVLTNAQSKPKITLDEFFNFVSFDSVRLSPDGNSLVLVTDRADWDQNVFRKDLWLYRGNALTQLTQSGYDRDPEWSPDGKWIAFLSERSAPRVKKDDTAESKAGENAQLYLISPNGGEAFAVTQGDEEVHAFSWSADSHILYFAVRTPWGKSQKDEYDKEWKDTIRYRAAERSDVIFSLNIDDAIARHAARPASQASDSEKDSDVTPGTKEIIKTPFRVKEMVNSPDGHKLAFVTSSISEREEKVEEFEIYLVDLAAASPDKAPRRLTNNNAGEQELRWSNDSQHIYFEVEYGSVEGKYQDTQMRLYWLDTDSGKVERWGKDFTGSFTHYAPLPNGGVIATARVGTEVQIYTQSSPSEPFVKRPGWDGTYEAIAACQYSARIAFVHSSLQQPSEVYMARRPNQLKDAQSATSFNQLFTQRDLPQGKPYRWKADDGTDVEGMLMYPPGKFEAKDLPMFVFIHGGPDDADGNHFEADWYVWDRLAANQGWLVFEPNYRGSTGYGDKFLEEIVPQIVSRPGKDILEGVDALVKDGIADPDKLAIGGYSYGGYMTNWLITQTTRFKAAVTGAGAVEHVANWGNDDTTFDDVYFLGGEPWESTQHWIDEAAIYRINQVRTPTHMVGGGDDIRVAVAENYLLDRALHTLGIPSTLLIFPGEGHSLDQNPWHGKIKVREELKWLEKYGGIPQQAQGDH
jgi:dipeptidyl aminopeptidase/acylaminoacyl peptidase